MCAAWVPTRGRAPCRAGNRWSRPASCPPPWPLRPAAHAACRPPPAAFLEVCVCSNKVHVRPMHWKRSGIKVVLPEGCNLIAYALYMDIRHLQKRLSHIRQWRIYLCPVATSCHSRISGRHTSCTITGTQTSAVTPQHSQAGPLGRSGGDAPRVLTMRCCMADRGVGRITLLAWAYALPGSVFMCCSNSIEYLNRLVWRLPRALPSTSCAPPGKH